ncbi:MAG: TolC family protein [Bacteroidales bacterium]|jgi:outer membrane protein TolC
MRRNFNIITLIFVGLIINLNSYSQQNKKDSVFSFTLKQAQDYALQNNPIIKNANLDIESAKKKIWETTAIGLPQINSKLAYSYMLTIPSKVEEFSSLTTLGSWMYGVDQAMKNITGDNAHFGYVTAPDPNQKTPSSNDLKWGLTYDITVSEIIFNGGYIVGLQTAKIYRQLSELGVTKSQNDIVESVTNAYYLVLIAQENKNIIDSTYSNTEKIFNNIKAMNAQGLVEETDVDQMQLTLSTLKNTAEMLTRQLEVVRNLLKFQLGIELNQNVTLTDKLDALIGAGDLSLASKEFNVENFADYKLMDVQAKLAGLNLKLQKTSFLPDIAAFYNHQENFNKNSFSFTPPDIIGLNVNIPIFGSGMKLARINQAKLALEKAINSKQQVSLGLQTSFAEAKSSYLNALSKFQTNKQNITLAEKIYKKNLIKYKEGVAGSLDLTQSQNQYLQAQSSYYSAIIELTTAKSKLEKMLK